MQQILICKNKKDEEMTVQQLKYILKVAEVGSITEAAKLLFISQPSLSNSIKEIGIYQKMRNSGNGGAIIT